MMYCMCVLKKMCEGGNYTHVFAHGCNYVTMCTMNVHTCMCSQSLTPNRGRLEASTHISFLPHTLFEVKQAYVTKQRNWITRKFIPITLWSGRMSTNISSPTLYCLSPILSTQSATSSVLQ